MAKQCGPYFITGTIGNLIFYKMGGDYYVRLKSTLSRKRVLKDAAFAKTRYHAGILKTASPIASRLYRQLDGVQKKAYSYRTITGMVMAGLKAGMDVTEVYEEVLHFILPDLKAPEPDKNEAIAKSKQLGHRKAPFRNSRIHSACLFNTSSVKTLSG